MQKQTIPLLLSILQLAHSLVVDIHTDMAIEKVDPQFLSVTLDMALLHPPKWKNFSFSLPSVQTLLGGLSPGYLRYLQGVLFFISHTSNCGNRIGCIGLCVRVSSVAQHLVLIMGTMKKHQGLK